MRKFLFFLVFLILAIFITALLAWTNKKTILTHFLSKQLHTAVRIETFDINKSEINLTGIWIGNPPPSKRPTAFTAQNLSIYATVDEILATPLVIEEIDLSNIFVGLELYNQSGDDTNWSRMIQSDKKESKQGRPYLIKTLILRNLTIEVTKADGTTKKYPTIQKMEFHDISNETGFPIEEIEKAIFKLMLQNALKQLNLDPLIQGLFPNAPSTAPLKLIPGLFGK